MQANDARLREKLRCCGEHPTLSGCEVLGRVEAERGGIASGADGTAAIAGGQGMRGVFHQNAAPPPAPRSCGDGTERIELGGVAGVMDRENRACARRHGGGDVLRIEVERIWLDIHQHWPRTHMLDHVHGRGERHGRGDDFVAWSDAGGHERGVQGGGARADRQRAGGLQIGGEIGFECPSLGSGRDPARAQRIHDLGDLFFADGWRG